MRPGAKREISDFPTLNSDRLLNHTKLHIRSKLELNLTRLLPAKMHESNRCSSSLQNGGSPGQRSGRWKTTLELVYDLFRVIYRF